MQQVRQKFHETTDYMNIISKVKFFTQILVMKIISIMKKLNNNKISFEK